MLSMALCLERGATRTERDDCGLTVTSADYLTVTERATCTGAQWVIF